MKFIFDHMKGKWAPMISMAGFFNWIDLRYQGGLNNYQIKVDGYKHVKGKVTPKMVKVTNSNQANLAQLGVPASQLVVGRLVHVPDTSIKSFSFYNGTVTASRAYHDRESANFKTTYSQVGNRDLYETFDHRAAGKRHLDFTMLEATLMQIWTRAFPQAAAHPSAHPGENDFTLALVALTEDHLLAQHAGDQFNVIESKTNVRTEEEYDFKKAATYARRARKDGWNTSGGILAALIARLFRGLHYGVVGQQGGQPPGGGGGNDGNPPGGGDGFDLDGGPDMQPPPEEPAPQNQQPQLQPSPPSGERPGNIRQPRVRPPNDKNNLSSPSSSSTGSSPGTPNTITSSEASERDLDNVIAELERQIEEEPANLPPQQQRVGDQGADEPPEVRVDDNGVLVRDENPPGQGIEGHATLRNYYTNMANMLAQFNFDTLLGLTINRFRMSNAIPEYVRGNGGQPAIQPGQTKTQIASQRGAINFQKLNALGTATQRLTTSMIAELSAGTPQQAGSLQGDLPNGSTTGTLFWEKNWSAISIESLSFWNQHVERIYQCTISHRRV